MKGQYLAVVHHEDGSAYGVHFPDLEGCFAAADDPSDILKNAIDALDDYLADLVEIPQPSSIEDVRKAAAEDLNEGAYLMAVPYIPRPMKVERVNVSIDRALLQAIDNFMETASIKNRSAFFAMAAMNEIRQSRGDVQ